MAQCKTNKKIKKKDGYKKYYAVSLEDQMIYRNPGELARDLNIDRGNVWKAARGERFTAGGKHIVLLDKNEVNILEYGKENNMKFHWIKGEN